MDVDMTQVFLGVLGLITVIITSVIVPWIKSKTTLEQQNMIRTWATIAVYAAQQLFTNSEEKKNYALQYVSDMLKKYNIELTANEISTYIEGALKDIKTSVDGADW
ncbi:MAG: phage holin [Clostridia bacterium]|nr:phage holin [Clostridia bacterium]